jgi:serine/threonine protein kinase
MLMDYLEGQSLAQKIKTEGPLSPDKAIHLFGQVAGALAHAHAEGIIHRDIKPSNIMIRTREDGTEQAVLVDFGIAKLQAAEELNQASNDKLTQTGDIFGTPQYMSCEQCLGQQVDERSDIYSFGCVMFESLTGKAPFSGDSVYEIIHKQINEAPPPFPKELRETLAGRRLEVVILRAMAKSPKNRQEYMLELASELQYCAGSAGAMGEIKTILGRLSGRRRAAEGKAALTKSLLLGLSFLGIFMLMVLLFSPVVINGIERGKARHQQILDAVGDFNVKFSNETNRRLEQRRAFFPSLEKVRQACAGDPLYEKKYDLVAKKISSLEKSVNDLFREIGKYDEEPSIPKVALPSFIAIGEKVNEKGRAFHDSVDRLNDIARDKVYDANHLLKMISFIDNMALFFLIPIVLGIAILLFNLRNEQVKAKEAGK